MKDGASGKSICKALINIAGSVSLSRQLNDLVLSYIGSLLITCVIAGIIESLGSATQCKLSLEHKVDCGIVLCFVKVPILPQPKS